MAYWEKNRKEYREGVQAVTGEAGWTIKKIAVGVVLPLIVIFGILGIALGWVGEGCGVAKDEFGAKASLKKYEWFIDQASRIDKMDADVALYAKRVQGVDEQYVSTYGADKTAWGPAVQLQYNRDRTTARDDLTAIVSQRNNLVREYDAQSEKFNWEPFNAKSDRPQPRYDESPLP